MTKQDVFGTQAGVNASRALAASMWSPRSLIYRLSSAVKPLKLALLYAAMRTKHRKFWQLDPNLAISLANLPPLESPKYLGLEVINTCNANCVFCEKQFSRREPAVMSSDFARRTITDAISLGCTGITFSCMISEPLLDKDLYGKIQHAYAEARRMGRSVRVWVITNGTLLAKNDNYKRLIDSGLDSLSVSTSSFDKTEYEQIYRIRKYSQMLEGLLLLLEENQKANYPVDISISIRTGRSLAAILLDSDLQLVLPFVDLRHVTMDFTHTYYDRDPRIEAMLTGRMRLRKNIAAELRKRPCEEAYSVLVTPHGIARMCSCQAGPLFNATGQDELVFADLNHVSLPEALRTRRKAYLNKRFMLGDMPSVCKHCDLYRPIPAVQ